MPTVDSTLGAVFIGFSVSCCLYGVFLTQVFSYFRQYFQDIRIYFVLVIIILILETADQVFVGHVFYYYTISNFNNPKALLQATVTWSLILQVTVGAVVGTIVKIYFGLRVLRFSGRNWIIAGLIILLSLSQLGLATAFTIQAFKLPDVFAVYSLRVLGTVSLAVGVLTDIVTAVFLCYFLSRLRTGYKSSDSLVNSLCIYAINTGAVTSLVSVACLIMYNVVTNKNLYFAAVYFILSKMYAISLMATLNTRRTSQGQGTDRQGNTSNNTNLFHLGTRVPTMSHVDIRLLDCPTTLNSHSQNFSLPTDKSYSINSFSTGTTKFA